MKVSARNMIPGVVKSIESGAVNSEIIIEITPGVDVVSIITKHSVENLGLKPGMPVKVMLKASNVMIAVDD